MAENLSSSPLFVGRYEFQTVRSDWDTGRTKFTHLVFDRQEERLGVIKRAEIKSPEAVERIKNEVGALLDLKGQGVPEIYDTGEAEYGSKKYFYMVIEFIDGIRIEKYLDNLSIIERSEIITQLFGLLSKAHQMGIVNGDVDLKHLFWQQERRQLMVIDWGNAKLHVNPQHKAEFAFDLARSAEIIYSLAVPMGESSVTGSLALPKDSGLWPGLAPVPDEFRDLCKWAPRIPYNTVAPLGAEKIFAASKQWSKAIQNKKPYRASSQPSSFANGRLKIILGLIMIATIFLYISSASPFSFLFSSNISTPSAIASSLTAIPNPRSHFQPITFSKHQSDCSLWKNESSTMQALDSDEGFHLGEDANWQFRINDDWKTTDQINADFSGCLKNGQIGAISLHAWLERLPLESEFGLFLEDEKGQKREYIFWIDEDGILYVKVREKQNHLDYKQQVILPNINEKYSVMVFLEINNQKVDILYLAPGPGKKEQNAEDIIPSQMTRFDSATRISFDNIQSVGLIGHGPSIQVILWPLTFFEK